MINRKYCLIIVLLIVVVLFVGCSNKNESEVLKIIRLEKNNYKLYYFKVSYDNYKENIMGIFNEPNINMDEEIIFGSNKDLYKGKDLIGLTLDEINTLSKEGRKLYPYDIKNLEINCKVSNVYYDEIEYKGKESPIKVIYSLEQDNMNNEQNSISYKNTKYSFSDINGEWLIYDVKSSYNSTNDNDDRSIEEILGELEYLKHNGEEVIFVEEFKLR